VIPVPLRRARSQAAAVLLAALVVRTFQLGALGPPGAGPAQPHRPGGPAPLPVDLDGLAAAGPAAGDAPRAELDLEVDVAAHPYRALRVAERREWTLALPADALHVTAGDAPRAGMPAVDDDQLPLA
jgi:hypothetical protein